jgi:hypothetical protein
MNAGPEKTRFPVIEDGVSREQSPAPAVTERFGYGKGDSDSASGKKVACAVERPGEGWSIL